MGSANQNPAPQLPPQLAGIMPFLMEVLGQGQQRTQNALDPTSFGFGASDFGRTSGGLESIQNLLFGDTTGLQGAFDTGLGGLQDIAGGDRLGGLLDSIDQQFQPLLQRDFETGSDNIFEAATLAGLGTSSTPVQQSNDLFQGLTAKKNDILGGIAGNLAGITEQNAFSASNLLTQLPQQIGQFATQGLNSILNFQQGERGAGQQALGVGGSVAAGLPFQAPTFSPSKGSQVASTALGAGTQLGSAALGAGAGKGAPQAAAAAGGKG